MNRELLLLGLLHQQEMHGYELHEFINTRLNSCTDMKKATAYYLLKKMENDGWLAQETLKEGNRPPRQIYHLTPEGERTFQRLLREHLAAHHPTYLQDDIGLAFLDTLPQAEARQLLIQRRAGLQVELDRASALPAHQGSLGMVMAHWRHHLTSELQWLDEVLAHLPETA
ncbi:MAG: PadR family transcriptional regulator [Anaerolineales bacterium]